MMAETTELTLTERINNLLSKYGSTQRWFVQQCKDAGIEMSDTKLSNRMTGFIEWNKEESKEIDKLLKQKFKA